MKKGVLYIMRYELSEKIIITGGKDYVRCKKLYRKGF